MKKIKLTESQYKMLLREFTNTMVMCIPWKDCMKDPDGEKEETRWFIGRLEHNEKLNEWYPYSIDSPKFKSRDEATTYMLGGGRYNTEPQMEQKSSITKKKY
tara:strand:- start:398 stop:703 length:306 start_codon:yes stop_codon:yes gene_type:complete